MLTRPAEAAAAAALIAAPAALTALTSDAPAGTVAVADGSLGWG
ncbi:hypothetical protein [Kitasatospora griseola]|nr:hypothetical protein [Kitasatospora griseola]